MVDAAARLILRRRRRHLRITCLRADISMPRRCHYRTPSLRCHAAEMLLLLICLRYATPARQFFAVFAAFIDARGDICHAANIRATPDGASRYATLFLSRCASGYATPPPPLR